MNQAGNPREDLRTRIENLTKQLEKGLREIYERYRLPEFHSFPSKNNYAVCVIAQLGSKVVFFDEHWDEFGFGYIENEVIVCEEITTTGLNLEELELALSLLQEEHNRRTTHTRSERCIASRKLRVRDGKTVSIEIFEPKEIPDTGPHAKPGRNRWECYVEIKGLAGADGFKTVGMESLECLMNAIRGIRGVLTPWLSDLILVNSDGEELAWHYGDIGIHREIWGFNLAQTNRLEELVDDEMENYIGPIKKYHGQQDPRSSEDIIEEILRTENQRSRFSLIMILENRGTALEIGLAHALLKSTDKTRRKFGKALVHKLRFVEARLDKQKERERLRDEDNRFQSKLAAEVDLLTDSQRDIYQKYRFEMPAWILRTKPEEKRAPTERITSVVFQRGYMVFFDNVSKAFAVGRPKEQRTVEEWVVFESFGLALEEFVRIVETLSLSDRK